MKPSCFKRMLAVFMAVIMICTLLPGAALAASTAGTVHVTIENTTFTTSDAPWTGTLLDAEVALTGDMSMLSAVTTALDNAGCEYTSNGDYISGINGLSEMQNGSLSGWMGTLNDWFVNTGFANYKESDRTLCDGDVIRVMYTSTGMGTDIGSGSYGNTDTALSALSVTGGTLEPSFAPAVTEYTLTVPSGTTEVNVNAAAKFKDHQVYLSVGEAAYRRTAAIPVADGTTITVQCGEPSIATTYTLKVKVEGESQLGSNENGFLSNIKITIDATFKVLTCLDTQIYQHYKAIVKKFK